MKEVLNKKAHPRICTSAIILNKKRQILLGLHIDKNPGPFWSTPGGKCDAGETIEECLRREVLEEIGVTNLSIKKHLCRVPSLKDKKLQVECFVCETSQEPKLMEPESFSEWRWFSKDEFPKNYINKNAISYILSIL